MNLFQYLKASFERKKARRITRDYPPRIDTFPIDGFGDVEFANWDNPLNTPIQLSGHTVNFFKKFIKEGDLAIDIGANIGAATVPISLCTGAAGLTLAFDPNPYVFKILKTNSTLNKGKSNIQPVPCAISVSDEEFYYISSEASFANGGISPTKDSRHGKFVYPEKIKGVNLLKYLEANHAERLSKFTFIKIDTEGYDKEILKSIADLILKYKPIIVAESFGKSSDEAKLELYDIIKGFGYDVFYFEDFHEHAAVEKLDDRTAILKWKETINVYALPS